MSSQKVRVTINGKELSVEPGTPVLQAAIDGGVEVPHFCYHPGIGVEGSCRLCLVEIAGVPKLQTSCTVPVKDGMVVATNSDSVKKARKGVLEFFLLNHPLDCPICDKGGECPLQNYSLDAGQAHSRQDFERLHKEKHKVIGEHIILDKERCVLCDRCVRFMRDFAGKEELGIRKRGARSEIFVPEGTSLTTGFTGNLADMCPVGALTSREFRFKARPWEMKTVDTVCGECSLGCSSQVWKKKTELLRMTPRVEPAVNEWWLCDRGRYSLKASLGGERILLPEKQGQASGSDRDAVARSLASEIRSVPKAAMAFVADPTLTNEEFFRLKLLAEDVGKGRVYVDVAPAALHALRKLRESNAETAFPTDLESAKKLMIVGTVLEESHPVLALRIRKLHHTRHLEVVQVGAAKEEFRDLHARMLTLTQVDWTKELAKGPVCVLVSDRLFMTDAAQDLEKVLDRIGKDPEKNATASILFTGANLRGMVDQWDSSVHPLSDLEAEIRHGRVEGLIWFGKAPSTPIFDEYLKGMRLFAQVILRKTDVHRHAQWVLPLDTFFEKKGTYTNTFGRVQTLQRTTRVVQKGFEPFEFLSVLRTQLGKPDAADISQIYAELAKERQGYPRSLAEIPASNRTYVHYERALWR